MATCRMQSASLKLSHSLLTNSAKRTSSTCARPDLSFLQSYRLQRVPQTHCANKASLLRRGFCDQVQSLRTGHHPFIKSLDVRKPSTFEKNLQCSSMGDKVSGDVHVLTVAPSMGTPASGNMVDKLEAAGFSVHKLWEHEDTEAFFSKEGAKFRVLVPSHGADKALFDHLPNLEIIANFGVGYDAIDVDAAKERGIRVTNTPDVLTDDVADLAIALLLDVSRRVTVSDKYVREGKWKEGNFPIQRKVSGKKLGILGLGRIGEAIATRAVAFNMQVAYHSRHEKEGVPYKYYSSLVEMAKAIDFLVVATPGGPSTQHLVNKEVLDALGPEGCLVNIARGSIVVESELVKALADGRLGSAGLDVFEDEPHVPEELIKMDNVVLQPHAGSATYETRDDMAKLVVDNLKAHFSGKEMLTRVA